MSPEERIAQTEARRAARKADLEKQRVEQYSLDLAALDTAEEEHGDARIARLDLDYTPGLPTIVVVKCPSRDHIKVYRAKVSEKKPDHTKAAVWLAGRCLVYPSPEVFEQLIDAYPGIDAQAGLRASLLSVAKAQDEGEG